MTKRHAFLQPKAILLCLTTSFCALFAQAANLYVSTSGSDSNAGTSSSAPLKTIQRASQLAQPGDVVNVAAGTYAGGFRIDKSGQASARITYKSTTKWGARIIPNGSNEMIWDQRGSYTDIVGFEIDGNESTTARYGIYSGGSYNTIQNNHVHHVAYEIPCDNKGGSAIGVDAYYRGVKGQVLNNVVHHIGPDRCHYVQGIYISTSAVVKNNLVYNVSEAAISLWHDANDVQIVNNTLAASGSGIVVGGGDFYFSTNRKADYVSVHNNIVYDNLYGISEQGVTGLNNKYLNNLVYSNSTKDWDLDSGKTHSGSISADPQFMAYSYAGSDVNYRLKSDSPALNKGTSSLAPATDINGVSRPQGGGIDLGAYELASTSEPAPTPIPPPPSAPIISLSASSLVFPSQLVGSTSAVQILTIKNSGTAALKFPSSFVMSGDFAFGGSGTCQVNVSYAPGASCTASVVFKPTAVGTRSGSLSIMSNASSSAKVVPFSGIGVSPTPAPVLSLSAQSLTFAGQRVGTTSAVQILTIKNSGTAALKFPSLFVMSGDFAFGGSGTCQVNVNYAPGASCTASVVFKPKAKGTRSGSLSISSNASAAPVTVKLTGTGL